MQSIKASEEAHVGEGDSEKPDWYWNGLGYDKEHPRGSAVEPSAPADSHHDVGEG